MLVGKTRDELKNNYDEIIKQCKESKEPIIITNNGKDESVIIDIDTYNDVLSRYVIYSQIDVGLEDIENGNVVEFDDAFKHLRGRIKNV